MRRTPGNRQGELFLRSKKPTVAIKATHPLVLLTDRLDWTELEELVETIRARKIKSAAGRPPHLRANLGAVILHSQRKIPYRDLEDQIQHYAPARYLCGLTETEWTPDFTTIHDFTEQMGEDGLKEINEYVVKYAVELGLCDPKGMVADTTAQEAQIPWPNEMGLMATFMAAIAAASTKVGGVFKKLVSKAAGMFRKAKEKVRTYRLFAKTKEKKTKLIAQMSTLVQSVQKDLGRAIEAAAQAKERLRGHGKVAKQKLLQLHETMKTLLPQIRYWLRTGWVAKNKIISLHIPELYSIVRGKIGKTVEFGLNWGIARLRGGYLLATVAKHRNELHDHRFAVRAVDDHIALFGQPPRDYAYDRGGYSPKNVRLLQERGVKNIALAPQGNARWKVSGQIKDKLIKERARVEGGIGSIKSDRYGFNRPGAKSALMMGACGQRAVLGFNLRKIVRDLAKRENLVLAGA